MLGLFFCKYFTDNAAIHRQNTVMNTGFCISRVKQHADAAIFFNQPIPGNNSIFYQVFVEIGFDLFTDFIQFFSFFGIAGLFIHLSDIA